MIFSPGLEAHLRFEFLVFDNASDTSKPLDLTGSSLTFRVYRPGTIRLLSCKNLTVMLRLPVRPYSHFHTHFSGYRLIAIRAIGPPLVATLSLLTLSSRLSRTTTWAALA
jgi:hypothetical protein